MKYGFILMGTPVEVVELAQEAEAAGWDGIFLSDDWMTAWIILTAIAMWTQRIRLGTMLTPLPEQLPWYVAAQTATLDQLSGGRVILTAGLGILELGKVGSLNNKVRAERLDEALEILESRCAARLCAQPLRGTTLTSRRCIAASRCTCICHSRNRVFPSGLLVAQSRVNSGAQPVGMAQ